MNSLLLSFVVLLLSGGFAASQNCRTEGGQATWLVSNVNFTTCLAPLQALDMSTDLTEANIRNIKLVKMHKASSK